MRILAGARPISKNYAEYGRKSANISSKLWGLFACSGMRGRFFVICSRGGAVARRHPQSSGRYPCVSFPAIEKVWQNEYNNIQ